MDPGLRDGFAGQRMRVVPAPVVAAALRASGTSQAVVTDVGWFPRAGRHRRRRPPGDPGAIVLACQAGEGWAEVAGVLHRVRPGQVVVIPPGVAHEYGAASRDPWSIWWLHVRGEAVEALLDAARLSAGRPVITVRHPDLITRLVADALTRLERDDTTASLLAASGAAWHLLSLLAAERVDADRPSEPVARAREYLAARLPQRTAVGEVASEVGLSASHLSRLFRAEMGMGILEHQTRQRMARATELLGTTDDTIAAIAHRVGYPDELYFSRQFRRVHQVSPREYRRGLSGLA